MDLDPGEHTIFEGHPSWRSILGFYIKGLLAMAVAGGIAAAASEISEDEVKVAWIAPAVGAVLVVLLIAGWLKRLSTKYVITDRRLYIKRGIIARREEQTQLSRVQNVNTNQSVLERLLRVGTVDFDTASADASDFSFKGVSSPQEVVAAVHRAQQSGEGL